MHVCFPETDPLLSSLALSVTLSLPALCSFVRPGMGYGQGPFTRMPENDAESAMLKDRFVCDLEPQWRKAFITKVYTLLVVQIAITVIICTAMMQFGGYDFYVWSRTAGAWTKLTSIIVTLCLICAMFSYKREHPLNLILLFSFTVCMSYSIGITTTAYAAAGLSVLVIEAFAITAIVFIGLTAFAMYSKIDFSLCAAPSPRARAQRNHTRPRPRQAPPPLVTSQPRGHLARLSAHPDGLGLLHALRLRILCVDPNLCARWYYHLLPLRAVRYPCHLHLPELR
jgi:hypothetical protein